MNDFYAHPPNYNGVDVRVPTSRHTPFGVFEVFLSQGGVERLLYMPSLVRKTLLKDVSEFSLADMHRFWLCCSAWP